MSEAWVNAKYDEHLNAVEEVAALRQRVSDLEGATRALVDAITCSPFGPDWSVHAPEYWEARRVLAVGSVTDGNADSGEH